MEQNTASLGQAKTYLYLPTEANAPAQTVRMYAGEQMILACEMRLARDRIDHWMYVELPADQPGEIRLTAEGQGFLKAAYCSDTIEDRAYGEDLRPQIHFTPYRGGIRNIESLEQRQDKWYLSYEADTASLEEWNSTGRHTVQSHDLVHWEDCPDSPDMPACACLAGQKALWQGDVDGIISAKGTEGDLYVLARSKRAEITKLPVSRVLSLPALCRDNTLSPKPSLSNLRVWKQNWQCTRIQKEWDFELRFRIGPSNWPEIVILEKDNTCDDIRADAFEIDAEILVGQEHRIEFDIAGLCWRWEALTQTLHCKEYTFSLPPEKGRIRFRLYSDRSVQDMFLPDGRAILLLKPDGTGLQAYKIKSELVENINNPSFHVQYYRDPYVKIRTPGSTAHIIELTVYALRSTRWKPENREQIAKLKRGQALYQTPNYTVYENCVEDKIYGDPPAWVTKDGGTVFSPVRAVEEFKWRDTPWGDMTRIIDRGEVWRVSAGTAAYPQLQTKLPVLSAAYKLAIDILHKNASEEYNLPGQAGLMNAALFQGKGEGFGVWVRDTSHAAFRTQNLVAPQEIRRSLLYITEHGFNNGVDSGAMPAIGIWDYYVATGDASLLFEALPGLFTYMEEADGRFEESTGLVPADMCPAQDAFPEPENGGYCLGTEILFAHTFLCMANICRVTDTAPEKRKIWEARGRAMLEKIKKIYWKEEAGYFTSGPKGSEAYQKGLWEMTGMELALWPRFEVSTPAQRSRMLQAIAQNPSALTDFGVNWYPFKTGKNHFWNACWVSWTLGMAAAAADVGRPDLLETLVFQQIRNVLLNKTFHEVIDKETGRAWRWPGLPWHAAAFAGFVLYGFFGISYRQTGLYFRPAVPKIFRDMKLGGLRYRNAVLDFEISGSGTAFTMYLDGKVREEPHIGTDLVGKHVIRFVQV